MTFWLIAKSSHAQEKASLFFKLSEILIDTFDLFFCCLFFKEFDILIILLHQDFPSSCSITPVLIEFCLIFFFILFCENEVYVVVIGFSKCVFMQGNYISLDYVSRPINPFSFNLGQLIVIQG